MAMIEEQKEREFFKNAFSKEIWEQTYKHHTDKNIQDNWKRVAKDISLVEDNQEKWEKEFFSILENFKFVAGGRILANSGTEWKASYINCFVKPRSKISDIDSLDGIMTVLAQQANTLKSEGGWGCNFSFIRPRGSFIKGIGVESPGSVKYMEIFDKSSEIITSGSGKQSSKKEAKGKIRKGAMMGVLDCWHPDIEEFVTSKQTEGRLAKFNISVGCYNDFMDRVVAIEKLIEDGQEVPEDLDKWDLVFPDTTYKKYKEDWFGDIQDWISKDYPVEVHKTIKVSYLWNLIMESTYNRNDPGILFLDRANETHGWNYGPRKMSRILETNPCLPEWAQVLTPDGISMLRDVKIGDKIWSKEGWTNVINKWSTGIKRVYEYKTTGAVFYSTDNHEIVSNGVKIPVGLADNLDTLTGELFSEIGELDSQDIMDGLVFGDGMIHKVSNDLVLLNIGQDDYDYFDSEISHLINRKRDGVSKYGYEIKTTIKPSDLVRTFDRQFPNRFLRADQRKLRGFLRGLYSANGSICGNRITLKASSFDVIESAQVALSSLGISSYYTTNKPSVVDFANGTYQCKESYDLNISTDRTKFYQLIGFIQIYKMDKLVTIINSVRPNNKKKSNFEIFEFSFVSEEEVFDITVDNDSHTFWCNGVDTSNCGEQALPDAGCCNLGSINLTQFVDLEKKTFNFSELERTSRIAVRFLDNVNSRSYSPLSEYKESMEKLRRIGLGVMGWASSLYMLGLRFGSVESCEVQEEVMKCITYSAIDESINIAVEKGQFEFCEKEKHYLNPYFSNISLPEEIIEKMKKHGIRNSSLFSIQPTGNTGIVANNVSGGLEPIFMHEYIRTSICPHPPEHIKNLCPKYWEGEFCETEMFKLQKEGSDDILVGKDEFGTVYKIDKNRGLTVETLCEDYAVKILKEKGEWDPSLDYAVSTTSLSVEEHVRDMTGFAKYIDSAISKTVNLPNEYSYKDFKKVYLDCYNSGYIKGFTTYRAGTMTSVLKSKDEKPIIHLNTKSAPKRPKSLPAEVHCITAKGEKFVVAVGLLDGVPYEILGGVANGFNIKKSAEGQITKVKRGQYSLNIGDLEISDFSQHFTPQEQTIFRMASTMMRHGVPTEFIVEQMQKSSDDIFSLPSAIARVLKKYIKDGQVISGVTCPECGSEKLVYSEGCKRCHSCQWTACS
jgi:ribonucleotide reductase alpha subunit